MSGSTGVSLAQQQAFVANNYNYAVQASQTTGLPVNFILGQAALESSYGTSNVANTYNNLFGITSGNGYASYSSPGASFQAYGNLITSGNGGAYSSTASLGSNPYTLAYSLANNGYNPSPSAYATAVSNTTNNVNNALAALGLSGSVAGTAGAGGASPAAGGTTAAAATTAAGGATGKTTTPYLLSLLGFTGTWGSAVSSLLFVIIGVILLVGAVLMYARSQSK